jgi:alkaline phosphatase D
VWSTWDDHDFLWNDAAGAALAKSPVHREKIRLSTAFHEAFRQALAQRLQAGAFPDAYNRAEFWDPAQAALPVPSVQQASDVWLHLSDGRTHRTGTWLVPEAKRALLGAAQPAALQAAPQALHLLDIALDTVTVRLYANDQEETRWTRQLSRTTWQPV